MSKMTTIRLSNKTQALIAKLKKHKGMSRTQTDVIENAIEYLAADEGIDAADFCPYCDSQANEGATITYSDDSFFVREWTCRVGHHWSVPYNPDGTKIRD